MQMESLGVKGENGGREGEHKILGVRWNCGGDNLVFGLERIADYLQGTIPSKREVVGWQPEYSIPLECWHQRLYFARCCFRPSARQGSIRMSS